MFIEVSEETWDETIDTDLKGTFFLAQFAARAMIAAGRGGRIVDLLVHRRTAAHWIFVALPARPELGLWSATQAMAKELAEHKILVNAVTPGLDHHPGTAGQNEGRHVRPSTRCRKAQCRNAARSFTKA